MNAAAPRRRPPPTLVPGAGASQKRQPVFQVPFDDEAKSTPYVLHVVPTKFGYLFSGSDDSLRAYDPKLNLVAKLPSRQKGITFMTRGPGEDSSAVFVCARDGTVTGWDMNDLTKPAFTLKGKSGAPYLACSQSADLNCLAVGAELYHHEATIDLWDLRTLKLAQTWSEAHSDDLTALAFHPTVPHLLLSASVDGLINTYDIRVANEDDSVMSTAQAGASVSLAGWMPLAEQKGLPLRGVWNSTTIETIQTWDAEDFTQLSDLGDVREVALQPWRSDYLIGCHYSESLDGLCILTGTQAGDIAVINLHDQATWVLESVLPSVGGRTLGGVGHADIVRCAYLNPKTSTLVTGGEDGQICMWSL